MDFYSGANWHFLLCHSNSQKPASEGQEIIGDICRTDGSH